MILMNDFKKEYLHYKPSIDKAIQEVLDSGWYILGEQGKAFETEFAAYIGTKYAISVGNGLEALQIALMALGIGKGDEVLTVSNSAVATALAISNLGATPIFVDIDEFYHIDTTKLEAHITPQTKAIIPVHLFGQTVDMDSLNEFAKKHNLAVIEDACQAEGASYKGKKAGALGTMGAFSFYPTKPLGAYGDGGAITTDSEELYNKCVMLRNYGQKDRYSHEMKGLNSRFDEIQAAVVRVKLRELDSLNQKRNKLAQLYMKELADVSQIVLPKVRENTQHAFHLFVIQAQNRDGLMQHLKENGIQSLIHYPIPIHKQKCYEEFNNLKLEKTEEFAKTILSLPMHSFMEQEEVLKVCKEIKNFFNNPQH